MKKKKQLNLGLIEKNIEEVYRIHSTYSVFEVSTALAVHKDDKKNRTEPSTSFVEVSKIDGLFILKYKKPAKAE